jgi:phosphatidylglycerophosphate synthase
MSKYKKGEALPLEEGLYNWFAPRVSPFLHEKLGLTPNMITTIGLIMGIVLIYSFYKKDYTTTAILIVLRQILDGLDGYIARTYNLQSEFGKKYDTYSDNFFNIIIIILITIELYRKSPVLAIFFLIILWVIHSINQSRFQCIKKITPECKDEKFRNFLLTQTKAVSMLELQSILALLIYSFNFMKK